MAWHGHGMDVQRRKRGVREWPTRPRTLGGPDDGVSVLGLASLHLALSQVRGPGVPKESQLVIPDESMLDQQQGSR